MRHINVFTLSRMNKDYKELLVSSRKVLTPKTIKGRREGRRGLLF